MTTARLIDLLDDSGITYGIVQPGGHDPSGVPIVRAGELQGALSRDKALHVATEVADRFKRTQLHGGELLVSVVGNPGVAVVAPDSVRGWNVARAVAVCRPKSVEAEWLALCFQTDAVQRQVAGYLNTTVQATLNLSDLKQLTIPVAPPSTRRGILGVLGALDDKIAANRPIVESVLSLVDSHYTAASPAGGDKSFAEVAVVSGGGTPSTKHEEFWGGDVQWATPTDVTALSGPWLLGTGRTITSEGLAACSSALYPAGSILMTSRATVGALALASRPVAVNQGFIVVQPNDPRDRSWLFAQMRARVAEFVSWANGATFLELSRGNFKRLVVTEASEIERARFDALATPLLDSVLAHQRENEGLAKTRDELLPLLMSGKIAVKDAEKRVEGVV